METQTAFDLNLAIQTWRENLTNSLAFRRENLNELESHLRDSVATLQTRSLSAEEAFLIATRRIGQSRQLESEFGKLNRGTIWLERAMWMLIGLLVWPFFDRLMSGVAGSLFVLGWRSVRHSPSEVGDAWPVFFSVLIQLSAMVVAACLTWIVLRKAGAFGQWIATKLPRRSSFVLCCFLVSLAVVLLYVAVEILPAVSFRSFVRSNPTQAVAYVGNSSYFIAPLRISGFVILTLFVARKRLVPEKA
jgi:hypothetical protein